MLPNKKKAGAHPDGGISARALIGEASARAHLEVQEEALLSAGAGVLLKLGQEALAGARLDPSNEEVRLRAWKELMCGKASAQAPHLWTREEALAELLQDLHCKRVSAGAQICLPERLQAEALEEILVETSAGALWDYLEEARPL